jgi:hypothetical protein
MPKIDPPAAEAARRPAPAPQPPPVLSSGRPLRRVLLVLLAILAFGLATVADYGFSTDEPWQMNIVRSNYELVRHGQPIQGEHRYYGVVFNVLAEAVFRLDRAARSAAGVHRPDRFARLPPEYQHYAERMGSKHVFTFLFTLIGYAAVAGLVGMLAGWNRAWLGPLVLAFFPRFWGHGFFNPKDIPFAVGYTVASLAAVLVVERLLAGADSPWGTWRSKVVAGAAFGALLGVASGLRIGVAAMLLTLPFVVLAAGAMPLPDGRRPLSELRRPGWTGAVLLGAFAILATWWVAVTIVHPSAWSNPVVWSLEAARYLSSHPWPGRLLFEGEYGTADMLPWYYVPKYVALTVPAVFLGAFCAGTALLLASYNRLSVRQRAAVLLVLLQVGFVPLVAILKGATVYDGMRQFLFMLPAMAVVAAVFLSWFYDLLPRWRVRAAAVLVLLAHFVLVGRDMRQLHPYQYVYFNRASGGVPNAVDRYELDYWALSFREATEWLNTAGAAPATVVVAGNLHSAAVFAAPRLTLLHYENPRVAELQPPFYLLALYKHGYQHMRPECPVVHTVHRKGVVLSLIRHCPGDS